VFIRVNPPAQPVQPAQWNLCCLYSIGVKCELLRIARLFNRDEIFVALISTGCPNLPNEIFIALISSGRSLFNWSVLHTPGKIMSFATLNLTTLCLKSHFDPQMGRLRLKIA
jgi:hypothetical protein